MQGHLSAVAVGERSNLEIVILISKRREDETTARAALEELSRRHRSWLERAIRGSRLPRALGPDAAEDIVQETFNRVWERAQAFQGPGALDEGLDRRLVRAWLGKIANHVAASMMRSVDALFWAEPLPEFEALAEQTSEKTQESFAQRIAREELDRLTEKEKDIVLEWLLHFKAGEAHQRMPNDVSQALAQRWATTPENIRQIRSRVLRRLRDAIERRTGSEP